MTRRPSNRMVLPRRSKCKVGDYVLATKYSDADPYDPWVIGFIYYIEERIAAPPEVGKRRRYWLEDAKGMPIVHYPKMRYARRITKEIGAEWVRLYQETT